MCMYMCGFIRMYRCVCVQACAYALVCMPACMCECACLFVACLSGFVWVSVQSRAMQEDDISKIYPPMALHPELFEPDNIDLW